jgi:rapamycin-insensitive companion of mTOR
MVFLQLIDRPHLRAFLRPDIDLEIALAGLTELTAMEGTAKHPTTTAATQAAEERMRSSGRLVTLMLRSWSGLMYLASGEQRALKSLIGALCTPSVLAKVSIATEHQAP